MQPVSDLTMAPLGCHNKPEMEPLLNGAKDHRDVVMGENPKSRTEPL